MRTTTVPAQITTVEDKIVGEISIAQLLLLVVPVFGSVAIFVLLPPFYSSSPYKIVLIVCLAVISGALAIRIKGKILLTWLLIMVRYHARPRYYLLNKNDTYLRALPKPEPAEPTAEEVKPEKQKLLHLPKLSTAELVEVEQLITNPEANLHFITDKKGDLRVHITEVR